MGGKQQQRLKSKEKNARKLANLIKHKRQIYLQNIFADLAPDKRIWVTHLFYTLLTPRQRKEFAKNIVEDDKRTKQLLDNNNNNKRRRKPSSSSTTTTTTTTIEEKEEQDAVYLDLIKRKKRYAQLEQQRKEQKEKAEFAKEAKKNKLATIYNKQSDPENYIIHKTYVDNNQYGKDKPKIQTFLYNTINDAHLKMKLIPKRQLEGIDNHSTSSDFLKIPPCGIYRWYDIESGMCYVGHSEDVWGRIAQHLSENVLMFSKSPFQQYIRKCGIGNLRVEILAYGEKLKDENIRKHFEAYFIAEYDSANPDKGWNVRQEKTKYDLEDSRRIVESHFG